MAKKNSIVSVAANDDFTAIHFDVVGMDSIGIDVTALSQDVIRRATAHGIIQKVSDAAALGKDASPADKHAAMLAVVNRLVEGDWNKRAGEGSNSAPTGLIFRAFYEFAVARAKKAKRDEPSEVAVRTLYDGKSRADQLALRNVPEIARIIDRIKSERGAKSDVDVDALIGDLDNL